MRAWWKRSQRAEWDGKREFDARRGTGSIEDCGGRVRALTEVGVIGRKRRRVMREMEGRATRRRAKRRRPRRGRRAIDAARWEKMRGCVLLARGMVRGSLCSV